MEVTHGQRGGLIKSWTEGVSVEQGAWDQAHNLAGLPFIHRHVALMPDAHLGYGSTVGSVIPTRGVVIPAAVGVDIGCGMMAVRTSLVASDLPDNLFGLRSLIETRVPHGRTNDGQAGDRGAWGDLPDKVAERFHGDGHPDNGFQGRLLEIVERHPKIGKAADKAVHHLGTLGTGNHFVEVCLDEDQRVWVMLHSGSRGIGNRIGSYFIERAKEEMKRWFINLPDVDLAYLPQGSELFTDYMRAVGWAQAFALANRELMMAAALEALAAAVPKPFVCDDLAVNCHHNYVAEEQHFGQKVFVTRKGAVRITPETLGIIPGSMGAKSFIVRGVAGAPLAESMCSCSHGAGRRMSRTKAKAMFSLDQHRAAVQGVECRVDEDVIDETPMAYKDIDAVMSAQADHVQVVHTLKQVVCVKG